MGKLQVNGDIGFTGAITTPGNDSVVIKPALNNYDQIGASDCKFWKVHATTFYGNLSGNADTATTASSVAWGNVTGKPSTFTPSDHSHYYLASRGNVTAESGTNVPAQSGLSMSNVYDNGYPTTYGNLLTMYGGGCSQLLIGWSGSSGYNAPAYIRSKRDVGDANWSSWQQLATTDGSINYSNSSGYASSAGNSSTCNGTALEWSGSIAWADTGWIAAWNSDGTKIKALNKNSFAPASHSHSYLPLSGGTMSGSPVIKFPASQGSIATSDPMAITYGRISAYGTLCINADSDGSTNEYLILTSGRGLSSSAADGLAIGYNTLTWQNNTVIHTGNIGSQSVNYATSAGNADRVYPINSNPNNSHPGYGLKVFYSWDQGQAGNDNGGYANGITIGSHPSDQAYGFQIVQNMWDDRTYTRRYNGGWQSWKTLAWTDDLAAYLPLSGGTMTGHLYATSGLSWNNSYWTPNGNITCTPTGNGQEWSFDVGASGYTGCYWHVWSSKNGCSMLRCDADTNAVGIPNGPLYLGSSCYGPNLPGASYVGQIFFKT